MFLRPYVREIRNVKATVILARKRFLFTASYSENTEHTITHAGFLR